MLEQSKRPYIYMLVGCCSFACMTQCGHAAGQYYDWQLVAIFRSWLVFLFVGIYAFSRRISFIWLGNKQLWMRSITGSFSMVTVFYSLSVLPASTVTTLAHTFPIWVALLSWPMLGKLPGGRVWVCVMFGVVGVYLIEQPTGGSNLFAVVVALLGAISTSLAMIGLHRLKQLNPFAIVVHFSGVAGIICLSTWFLFPRMSTPPPFFHSVHMLQLLGVGVFAAIGQSLLTKAFAGGDPARVSVIGLSQILFSLIMDVAIMGHQITSYAIVGTSLIIVPTAWLMLERKKPVISPVAPPKPAPKPTENLGVAN